ncbi:hypothetical protein GE061_006082 [Apolygus lucorum]|uniref:Uncharacterized protein n=1 Tax=Apolygus lucorum TaxID=248454 RepID=A0A8S9WU95_APOLU|nr:hypothetical protein GE061_006082 [Apolygus lucorum]
MSDSLKSKSALLRAVASENDLNGELDLPGPDYSQQQWLHLKGPQSGHQILPVSPQALDPALAGYASAAGELLLFRIKVLKRRDIRRSDSWRMRQQFLHKMGLTRREGCCDRVEKLMELRIIHFERKLK